MFFSSSAQMASSMNCMPCAFPEMITSWSFCVAPSRMMAATAALATRISLTAMRPGRSDLFKRSCATTPRREFASMARACPCLSAGKASIIRSTVFRALFVWRVPMTRRPVSAAVRASEIVSKSRISPMSTISVSSRSAALRAAGNEIESPGTSRCVMMLRLLLCTNSIGSSIVTTCLEKFWLMKSMRAA